MDMESPFGSYAFSATDIMDIIGVSKPTFSTLQKQKVIEAKIHKVGAVNKKVYDWNDMNALYARYKDRLPAVFTRKVQTFTNLKGGVGKTTISTQYAMRAAQLGKRVLFIDLDPQGNGSFAFGFQSQDDTELTIFDCLSGKCTLDEATLKLTPNFHLVPAHIGLNHGEISLRSKNNGQQKLKLFLQKNAQAYDLVVIDTNAALSYLSINAILAATEICVTVQTSLFSVSGMTEMVKVLNGLHDDYPDFNPGVRIIPNMFDANKGNCVANLDALKEGFSDFITNEVVRNSVDFDHAQNAQQSVIFHKKKSNASSDIDAVTRELLTTPAAKFYSDEED